MDDVKQTSIQLRASSRSRILAVDDTPMYLMMAQKVLAPNYEVITAKSGEEALETLSHTFVDLVVSDIEMPGLSGVEMFEKMLDNSDCASIPVVFVTSDKDSNIVQQAIGLGAKDYIAKPYVGNVLLAKVQRILSHATQDQAVLFLQRRMEMVVDCCTKGNIEGAKNAIGDIPQDAFSNFLFLKLNRVLSALHNRDFNQAREIALGIVKEA